jgi:hypothetical protein
MTSVLYDPRTGSMPQTDRPFPSITSASGGGAKR